MTPQNKIIDIKYKKCDDHIDIPLINRFMMMLVLETDSVLREKIQNYDFNNHNELENLSKIIDDMHTIMLQNGGIGLAAPQIGLKLRLFIMNIDDTKFECINPEIIDIDHKTGVFSEGCLSFPGLILKITRPEKIYVKYSNRNGISTNRWMDGLIARCFQHELDHLNGITFDTLVSKMNLRLARDKRRKNLKKIERRFHE